jgi:amino acid permease
MFHFSLRLVGGATKPYEATVRAIAYATGATSILQFIPLCGGYLYPIANFIYSVIAIKEVHRTDMWRVVLAGLILFMLVCGIVLASALVIVALAQVVSHGLAK